MTLPHRPYRPLHHELDRFIHICRIEDDLRVLALEHPEHLVRESLPYR